MSGTGRPDTRRSTRSKARGILDTPVATRHRSRSIARTLSNATSRNSIASSISPLRREQQRRKRLVRKSLLRPQVHELTIGQRARILADVAGDCLVKVIRAGLQSSDETWLDCERAWQGFQTMRSNYILGENPPPIVLYEDILGELSIHPSHDLVGLNRAIELCNLATLAYLICRPDEAGTMGDPPLSRKGKERASPAFLAAKVSRRNVILCDAWEKYWMILPEDQRDKQLALQLWLQFATQIYLNFQMPSIYPTTTADAALPEASTAIAKGLFDPFAIARLGRWEPEPDDESQGLDFAGMDQEIVEARWRRAADRRRVELSSSSVDDLRRKYRYEDFRQAFLEYLDSMVSSGYLIEGGSDAGVLSDVFEDSDLSRAPSHPRSVRHVSAEGPDYPTTETYENATPRRVTRSGRQAPLRSAKRPRSKVNPLEGSTSESEVENSDLPDEKEDDETGEPIQWDMFQDIAMQMQEQYDRQATPTVAAASAQTPGKGRDPRSMGNINDAEWEVHDGATPRALVASGVQPAKSSFNFSSRQPDAVQVEWDSQTRARGRQVSEAPSIPYNNRPVSPPLQIPNSLDRQFEGASGDDGEGLARRSASISSIPSVSLPPSPPPVRTRPLRGTQPLRDVASARPSSTRAEQEILVQATAPQLGSDIEEINEEIEGIEEGDLLMEDLMPDTLQLTGDLQSSAGPQTPDSDLDDLMPAQSQILGGLPTSDDSQKTVSTQNGGDAVVHGAGEEDGLLHYNPSMDFDLPDEDEIATEKARVPTSQRRLTSSRVHRSGDALEFALPDSDEDAEDRALLSRRPPLVREESDDEIQSVKEERASSLTPGRVIIAPPPIDPYMVDEDGNPLEPNPEYVIPPDHVKKKTQLHGIARNGSSCYSRLSGPRKWTEAEALLMYRTIQQVPIEEPYPIQVVWYLFGEHGVKNKMLRYQNPQHMKDKMRTIVNSRTYNNKPVVGRARAFLKPGTEGRKEYDREIEARREAENARRAALEAEEEVEEVPEKEAESAGTSRRGKKQKGQLKGKAPTKRKRASRKSARGRKHDDEDDLDEDTDVTPYESEEGTEETVTAKKKSLAKRKVTRARKSRETVNPADSTDDAVEEGPSGQKGSTRHQEEEHPTQIVQTKSKSKDAAVAAVEDTAEDVESSFDNHVMAQDVEPVADNPVSQSPPSASATPSRRIVSGSRWVPEVLVPTLTEVAQNKRPKRVALPKQPRNLKTKAARKTVQNPLDDLENIDEEEHDLNEDHSSSDFDDLASNDNFGDAVNNIEDDAESQIVDDALTEKGNDHNDPADSSLVGGGTAQGSETQAEERAKRAIHEYGLIRSEDQSSGEARPSMFEKIRKKVLS